MNEKIKNTENEWKLRRKRTTNETLEEKKKEIWRKKRLTNFEVILNSNESYFKWKFKKKLKKRILNAFNKEIFFRTKKNKQKIYLWAKF